MRQRERRRAIRQGWHDDVRRDALGAAGHAVRWHDVVVVGPANDARLTLQAERQSGTAQDEQARGQRPPLTA